MLIHDMKADDDIDELSYLWEEDGWALSATHVNQTALRVIFEGDIASVAELKALRKLVDKYRDVPPSEVRAEVGQTKELSLGVLPQPEAARVIERGRGLGLRIAAAGASYISYLPINPVTKTGLIIEDEDLQARVVERMLDAGAPVVSEAELC